MNENKKKAKLIKKHSKLKETRRKELLIMGTTVNENNKQYQKSKLKYRKLSRKLNTLYFEIWGHEKEFDLSWIDKLNKSPTEKLLLK